MKKMLFSAILGLGFTFAGIAQAHHDPAHAVCYKSIAAGGKIVYCYPLPPYAPMPNPAPFIITIP